MSELAIQTSGLTMHFEALCAVNDLTLDVPTGTVFGFLGPNGAGKTTTIRLLLGLLQPSQGHAEVLGHNCVTQADMIREKTGALLEHHGLYERLTAEDNLEYVGRINRMSSPERQSRIKELLNHLGLWDRRKERVGTWSRGMKQKLAVARALFHRPSLVFLDEPTAGFDPEASASLREDLQSLVTQEGTTVFLTTHNLAEAEKLCSRVGVIKQGTLVACGPPHELRQSTGASQATILGEGFTDEIGRALLDRPEILSVQKREHGIRLELQGEVSMAPIVRFLVEQNFNIEEVQKGRSSLEEAYLALMEDSK